jgi:RimJ/RimL family protein N-acetyltransferase
MPPDGFALARLRLRRPRLADANALLEIGSDPEVARYADWPLCTELGPTLERLRQRAEQWDSGAEYYWIITLANDDRAIGAVSTRVDRHAADVGYLLGRRHWGHGYATEAARAIVDWAFSVPAIHRVWATCDTQNVASARVLERIGLELEGTLRRAIVRPNLSSEPRDAFLYAKVR